MKKIKILIKKLFNILGFEILKHHNNLSLDIHLKYLLNKNKYDLIIDVGANEGQFGQLCRNIGYKGLILSFEPVKEAYSSLIKNEGDNWRCFNIALGSSICSKEIKIYKSNLFSSFLDKSDYGDHRFSNELSTYVTQTVSISTLDEILQKYSNYKNIFLKMDTQGYDLQVFTGAKSNLHRITLILSEISFCSIYKDSPDFMAALNKFNSEGYKITGLFPMNLNDDGSIVEMDAVLIRST